MWAPFAPDQQWILTKAEESGEAKVVLRMGSRSCVVPVSPLDDAASPEQQKVRKAPPPQDVAFAGLECLPHERRLQKPDSWTAQHEAQQAAASTEPDELSAREWLDMVRRGFGACRRRSPSVKGTLRASFRYSRSCS